MIVCGDIGGTKTQLALINPDNPTFNRVSYFLNTDYDSFESLLHEFLYLQASKSINQCVLAVAGQVHENHCQLTNLPWYLNATNIAETHDIEQVVLINDLAATAYGIPYLLPDDFVVIQGNQPFLPRSTIGVLSSGTGLGEAILYWDSPTHCYKVLSGEGGHKDLSIHSEKELDFYHFCLTQNPGQTISCDSIISGQGLSILLTFLAQSTKTYTLNTSLPSDNDTTNQTIIQLATKYPKSIYAEALKMFTLMMANEASNLALQANCDGGIVLAGGIPPRIIDVISKPEFTRRFRDKAVFSQWLKTVPIAVCTNTRLPVIGAYHYLTKYHYNP